MSENNDDFFNVDIEERRPAELRGTRSFEKTGGLALKLKSAEQTAENGQSEQDKRLERRKKAILRKTRKRENSLQCLNISVIVALFSFISLFLIFGERPTVSYEEKRDLAAIPEFTWESYFDGSFTAGFSEFFNDTVPARANFKTFISLFRGHFGIDYGGVEIHGKLPVIDGDDNTSEPQSSSKPVSNKPGGNSGGSSSTSGNGTESTPSSAESNSGSSSSESPKQPEPQDGDGEMEGTVFVIKGERGIALFGGSYKGGTEYAQTISDIKAQVGDGVNFYSMVMPTAGSYYMPARYKNLMGDEQAHITNINNSLVGVMPVNIFDILDAHKDEDIYFKTDHHWQQLGAFYAAEEFAKVAGVPFIPLSEYTKESRDGYVGSLYGYSGESAEILKVPDTFTYYKPPTKNKVTRYDPDMTNARGDGLLWNIDNMNMSSWYLAFGVDNVITHIETECTNGRTLVMVGDSYDNAMVSTLTGSFSDIWVVDMRAHLETPYFAMNIVDFIKKKGATDVLFSADTFSAVGSNRNGLKAMLDGGLTLPDEN